MKERQRRSEGARRAGESRAQLAAARQKQRTRKRLVTAVVALLAVAGVSAGIVVAGRIGPQIGESVPTLHGIHAPPYAYNTRPPTSGNHTAQRSPYGYADTLVPENVVHNMEHGAVVIWHKPGDDALARQVSRLANQLGPQCLVAGAYADMDATVAVTGWGRMLELSAFDEEQIRAFVAAYRGKLGPEAGVCRSES